jgi:hypothetical protein
MQLELDAADSELLEQILVGRLGDLRMEISNTDDFDFRKGLKEDEGPFPFPHAFPPLLPFGGPYPPMNLMRPFDSRLPPPMMLPMPPYPMPQGYYPHLAMHPGPSAQQQQLLYMQQQQQQQMMMNHFPPGFNPQGPFLFPPPALSTGFAYPVPKPVQEGLDANVSENATVGEEAYADEVKHEEGMIEVPIPVHATALSMANNFSGYSNNSNNSNNNAGNTTTTTNNNNNKIF